MKLCYYVLIMSITNTSGIQPSEKPHTDLQAECCNHLAAPGFRLSDSCKSFWLKNGKPGPAGNAAG